jgi:CrcB protein
VNALLTCLWVAIGGALGSVARYGCSRAVALRYGEAFPWGTLAVNVAGSLFVGLIAGVSLPGSRLPVPPDARTFLIVGLCGGFTTFSSFSLQTLDLIRNRDFDAAFGNVVLSVVSCLAAVAIGYVLGTAIGGARSSG